MSNNDWHLRIGLTSQCNFRCRYCLPNDVVIENSTPSTKEIIEILQAAYDNGIKRVHYTGGEPTVRKDLCDIIAEAKTIGFTNQIITTNGALFPKIADKIISSGLTRAIISIDSLIDSRYKFLTRRNNLKETLETIDICCNELSSLTKLSVVTMRSTLEELKDFYSLATKYNGKLAVKLNQFFPCNPAQLDDEGKVFWKDEYITHDDILKSLKQIGSLKNIDRSSIEGDNPSYQYYQYEESEVVFAILALFSWDYPCGLCKKLRISPQGFATSCINQPPSKELIGKNIEQKCKIFKELIAIRESSEFINTTRKHYRAKLGELRFGNLKYDENSIEHYKRFLESP